MTGFFGVKASDLSLISFRIAREKIGLACDSSSKFTLFLDNAHVDRDSSIKCGKLLHESARGGALDQKRRAASESLRRIASRGGFFHD